MGDVIIHVTINRIGKNKLFLNNSNLFIIQECLNN